MKKGFWAIAKVAPGTAAILATLACVGGPAWAKHRHRQISPEDASQTFDRRPALPQAVVGAMSLEILAAGAANALAAEYDFDDAPPLCYPEPPAYCGDP